MSLTRLKLIGYVIPVIPSLLVLCAVKMGGVQIGKRYAVTFCDTKYGSGC